MKFLDYLLEGAQPAVLVGSRVLRVSVPDPARFAIHTLLVSSERPSAEARKDVDQAVRLLRVLLDERPADLERAWHAATERGRAWTQRLNRARRQLPAAVAERMDKTPP